MLTSEQIKERLNMQLPHLKQKYGVKRIAIFGSSARGERSRKSDIDLYIEFERPIGFAFMELADYLQNLLGKKVDILTKAGVESIRQKEVAESIKRSLLYV
jgi:predicted nucleotidyltransferase